MREEDFDGQVEILGHGDHDVSTIYPKDIVEEEGPEQEEAGFGCAERKGLEGHNGEQDTEDVVEDPVFGEEVVADWEEYDEHADDSCVGHIELLTLEKILQEGRDID